MADPIEIESEDVEENCYDGCFDISFSDVIGAKTLTDGGHFGDLLRIARIHINDAKKNGELTDGAAGEVYAKAIEAAMAQSTSFGLQAAKYQIDIKLVDAQVKYQLHKIKLERDQFDLDEYIRRAELGLTEKKTLSDIRVNDANIIHIETQDKQIFQQIKQSNKEIDKMDAEITRMECDCKNQTAITNSKLDVDKATIVKMSVENDIGIKTSTSKIKVDESTIIQMAVQNDVSQKATNSKIKVEEQQITQMKVQDDVSQRTANSTIEVNNAQIIKMAVDNNVSVASANSKIYLEKAQVSKISVDALNETALNRSKIDLNNYQVAKMRCDCINQEKISTAQANLYRTQELGFRDNARQKVFEAQMQGYAMVFEAAEFDQAGGYVPDFFTKNKLDSTFNALVQRTFT